MMNTLIAIHIFFTEYKIVISINEIPFEGVASIRLETLMWHIICAFSLELLSMFHVNHKMSTQLLVSIYYSFFSPYKSNSCITASLFPRIILYIKLIDGLLIQKRQKINEPDNTQQPKMQQFIHFFPYNFHEYIWN